MKSHLNFGLTDFWMKSRWNFCLTVFNYISLKFLFVFNEISLKFLFNCLFTDNKKVEPSKSSTSDGQKDDKLQEKARAQLQTKNLKGSPGELLCRLIVRIATKSPEKIRTNSKWYNLAILNSNEKKMRKFSYSWESSWS